MLSTLLAKLDEWLFQFLLRRPASVPARLKKFVAAYYPDARVRKLYWVEYNVHMGEGSLANPGLLAVTCAGPEGRVTIGRNVSIAPGVVLITDSSPNNSATLRAHPEVARRMIRRAPIVVGDDVWLGAGVVVLPGITIGRCTIVGAGAVVTRDLPPFAVAAGVPARVVRRLSEQSSALGDSPEITSNHEGT
jgi:acetyltransferase-like isoleucine patch superfamily enzyme